MNIVIGCDKNAFSLKEIIKEYLHSKGINVVDVGVHGKTDDEMYPDVAVRAAEEIRKGNCERGILLCGTGIGMAIAANKVPGIYAAVCHDPYSAERARKSNNAQIITMGALVIGEELAKRLVEIWLTCEFEKGRSLPKVKRIAEYEQLFHNNSRGCPK